MAKKKAVKHTSRKASPPLVEKSVQRYENVLFEFPSDDMRGTVLVRRNEMVLDIPKQNGLAPSLIIGRRDGHVFRGKNSVRDENALTISAAWCNFGPVFAGLWIEEGNELLFSFRLPR